MKGSKKKNFKVLVTGGAGFIGSHLVDALVAAGHKVLVIDNFLTGHPKNLNPEAKFYQLDICDLKSITPCFRGVDYVFHVAAMAKVPLSVKDPNKTHIHNVLGTLNVLLASRDAGVKKVIYSSSSSVYGDQKTLPLHEKMVTAPVSPYGLQKLTGEKYCQLFSRLYGLKTVCLRYFNVYGPRQRPTGAYVPVIATFLLKSKIGEPLTIYGNGLQTRDFTHVNDVVRANILAMKSKKAVSGEAINIGGGRPHKIIDLAKAVGGQIKILPHRAGDLKHSFADIRLAQRLLGWQPKIKLEDGIKSLEIYLLS